MADRVCVCGDVRGRMRVNTYVALSLNEVSLLEVYMIFLRPSVTMQRRLPASFSRAFSGRTRTTTTRDSSMLSSAVCVEVALEDQRIERHRHGVYRKVALLTFSVPLRQPDRVNCSVDV